jgi:hypothetical protein
MEDSRTQYCMCRTLCKIAHYTEIGNQHKQYNSIYLSLSEIFAEFHVNAYTFIGFV